MNNIQPTIKFTFTYSTKNIFLDATIYYNRNHKQIILLHYTSNDPKHTKSSIIYSEALLYNLIIHDDEILQDLCSLKLSTPNIQNQIKYSSGVHYKVPQELIQYRHLKDQTTICDRKKLRIFFIVLITGY